ncbi:hypothetical protein [Burkholderia sp. Leaf177]|uniref:hypothetical protein n=1 Tax=Burkholderia sp. Leaf177 TaxID=1736287 RepID=UPI0009EA8584|nr:hypothetical protein [Burkholderia sp. Leaf177]
MKAPKLSGYWIFVGSVTVGMATLAYFKGSSIDPSPFTRVVGVLLIGAVLLLLQGWLKAAWLYVASRAPGRNVGKHERDPAAKIGAAKPLEIDIYAQRVRRLKLTLQQTYGWRWRNQQPWLLVTGDQESVDRLSPGLSTSGWAITPEAILLYAGATGKTDENWLKRIRSLRRRSPVNASVQIMHMSDASVLPSIENELALSLFSQARILGWAPPAYLLSVVDIDGAALQGVKIVASTWSNRKGAVNNFAVALSVLSRNLASAG